jgi:hypothetical protein
MSFVEERAIDTGVESSQRSELAGSLRKPEYS